MMLPDSVESHRRRPPPPINRATTLPKLQPTTEQTNPDRQPITLLSPTPSDSAKSHRRRPPPPMNKATALPKVQPTIEQTTPDPQSHHCLYPPQNCHPWTIAVNHHQPEPRLPSFLAKPTQTWPLHWEALPGMEFRRQRPPPQPLDRRPMSMKTQMHLEQDP
ncbi:proline-rich receptor-like protein kinase PERK9 [Alnus glutinosa]|uniref:proline-rich receptor-like protein kinase PERK9 n=1 Tax=Alnus glutinosa TaxID=3517 RepID=UPI002D77E872|nr:proline-rich receptor-like protein kinase PERK9 [Alnus glutinosa]